MFVAFVMHTSHCSDSENCVDDGETSDGSWSDLHKDDNELQNEHLLYIRMLCIQPCTDCHWIPCNGAYCIHDLITLLGFSLIVHLFASHHFAQYNPFSEDTVGTLSECPN